MRFSAVLLLAALAKAEAGWMEKTKKWFKDMPNRFLMEDELQETQVFIEAPEEIEEPTEAAIEQLLGVQLEQPVPEVREKEDVMAEIVAALGDIIATQREALEMGQERQAMRWELAARGLPDF